MKSSGLRVLAIIVFLLAFAGANVGSFLLGRASAEHNSVSWEEASVFYAQIVERRENTLLVEGLPVNDVNHRGQFSFTLGEDTRLLWRGEEITVCIGEKEGEPQFTITDILPHLGKDQMAKTLGEAISGEDMNVLAGSLPLTDGEGEQLFKLNIMNILHQQYGIVESDLISAELEFVPAFKAVDIGFDRSMIGAYGHDDRVCAYPILEAIFQCKTPEYTCITVLADKEEIGSVGNTGLASEYLNYFVADLAAAEGLEARHVYTKSTCLSADVTAAFDPNYAYAYEAGNSTFLNRGVGLSKYTGSRGKGGSNDANAEFVGPVRKIFDEADVLWQIGELGKVDQGGGGTVALDISRMNADVIDVGVPVLSMHSPFEVVSKLDVYMAYKGFKAYFEAE